MESILFYDDSPVTDFSGKFPDADGSKILIQYTGLKDKNGKEIYEGDIIKYTYTHYRKPVEVITDVIWQYFGFYIRNNQTKFIDSRALLAAPKIFEVIGNIYENPELIS